MMLFFINPFMMFSFSFIGVIILYKLKLSDLYEIHSDNYIVACLLVMSIISFAIGIIYHRSVFRRNAHSGFSHSKIYLKDYSFYILILGFILECINNQSIPIVTILRGQQYDYTQFGIKTFHVFYMAYLSASAIVHMERFFYSKDKRFLKTPITAILITILIVNRGATILILLPMTLMSLTMLKEQLKARHVGICMSALLLAVLVFGFLGDKRLQASGYEDSQAIYDIGKANPVFIDLPSGFFWTYLYTTSPLANLALQSNEDLFRGDFSDLLVVSIYPDFISKYTNHDIFKTYDFEKITPELNVGTGFITSYIVFGVYGVVFLFFWYLAVNSLCIYFRPRKYSISLYATLASISSLMIFNNMFIFSSCFLQLTFIMFMTRFRVGKLLLL